MENLENFSGPDQTVIRNVLKYLRSELSAVSACVALPSGRAVTIYRWGNIDALGAQEATSGAGVKR